MRQVAQFLLSLHALVPHSLTPLLLGHGFCRRVGVPLRLQRKFRPNWIKAREKRGSEPLNKAYYCEGRNDVPFSECLSSHRKKYFFHASDCKQNPCHVRFIVCGTAEKLLRGEGLRCIVCHRRKGWTKSEALVEDDLKTGFPHLEYFPECRVLEGLSGSINFAILGHRVLIQADGPSHTKPLKYYKAAGEQQQLVDERCNQHAIEQGWHMLSIHENDRSDNQGISVEVLKTAEWCAAGAGMLNLAMNSSLSF